MQFSWEAAGAAFTVFGAIAGTQLFVFHTMVENLIRRNNDELLKRVNGTYVKSEVLNEKIAAIKYRLGVIEGGD